mmetsp:Transcript_24742/g.49439  ORF Transcript_24742/g.49439 Transcript_24742/m.49439 type:complete len:594 (-) Transcript_24742:225-2006(-)
MASFAEVAAQTESVIPLPSAGESSDDCMRTSATFLHQQAATDAPSQTIFASNGILYGDAIMQTEEGSHYIPAQQPAMTSSASPPTTGGASGALSALAALATSAAMQRDTPMQPHQQLEDDHNHHHHHQILHSSAPIAIARNTVITPHQTSSDDDSEAMPPPPPRIPTTVPPLQPQPYPTSVDSDGFTSILAFHNDDTTSLFSSSAHYHNQNKRVGGRIRSASNPEGMEKWDSYTRRNDRMHFVLPSSILEEELASTKRILEEKRMEEDYVKGYIKKGDAFSTSPCGAMAEFSPDHHHHVNVHPNVDAVTATTTTATASRRSRRQHKPKNIFGTSPDSVTSDLTAPPVSTSKSKKKNQSSSTATSSSSSSSSSSKCHINEENLTLNIGDEEEEDIDESLLEPEELLRRARSRLLEDLSEGSEDGVNGGTGGGGLNGEKGVLTLPHSLGKYKEVYNKNGRIGIYTPAERAAIIQKFNAKRARRVWNKKIRYNCRKNLADRRMRVKGRFVKRSVEAANSPPPPEDENDKAAADAVVETISRSKNSSPPTTGSPLTTVNEGEEHDDDEAMPDVADEEAGFNPTEDMPYRRTRRYTIT